MRSSEQTTDQLAGSTVSLTEKLATGCESYGEGRGETQMIFETSLYT